METTWEDRMAARTARPRVSLLADEAAAARLAFLAENGQHHASPEPPPVDVDPICRECFAWRPIGNWPDVWIWHLTCRHPVLGNCDHAHHADEVWIG
jgi:hypothetical protein